MRVADGPLPFLGAVVLGGLGTSGDARAYSLQKEAEDAAAVVESRPGKVFVLGHSFGGVVSLEAAVLTGKIAKLILYEPPVRNPAHAASPARCCSSSWPADW